MSPRPHDPSNGHATKLTITSGIHNASPSVHPPVHLCAIFTGLHTARIINAASLIKVLIGHAVRGMTDLGEHNLLAAFFLANVGI